MDIKTRFFSHIYVEHQAAGHPVTNKILKHFPGAKIIYIQHYKDVFNRSHQNFFLQKQAPALILAKKEGKLVYPGAPVCQNFGNHYFYYTSCMMNCIYDCEYCYLQGMYPSGNMVVFVNLEDIFSEVDQLLKEHPVYLCVSYDTDLMAFEGAAGFVKRWYEFAAQRPQLTIEIRTKSGAFGCLEHLQPVSNVIFAWTLSPQCVIEKYEHYTASLQVRLKQLRKAAGAGFTVRICFDPLIYVENFKEIYEAMVHEVFSEPVELMDASIGVFRVSVDYLKQMRRQRPDSQLLWYPFVSEQGVYHYGSELSIVMTGFVKRCLERYMDENKIFIWNGENNDRN